MGNVLTRATHFAHHSFYSKLVLKANIFPALGFSLLLKHDKYLPVMSQGQSLWVCQICSTCVKWMFPPPDRENFSMSLQSLPKIPPWNGGKMLWGQKKTRPAMGIPQSHLRHPRNLCPGSCLLFPSPLPISPVLTTHLPQIFTQDWFQLLMRIILVWGILFSTEGLLCKALCRTPGTRMSLRHPAGKTAREGKQREGDNLDLIKKIFFFGHLKLAVNPQLLEFWFDLFAFFLSSSFSGGRKLHLDKIIYCEVMLESRTGPQEGGEWHRTRGSWHGLGGEGP